MVEHNESGPRPGTRERYRHVEYDWADGSVSVIQDTQNQRAWIQSTLTVAVER